MVNSDISHVAYLGPKGTHSYHALEKYLNPSNSTPYQTITQVFQAVADGKVGAGFVPIENVIHGPITEVLDQLLRYKGEIQITDSYLAKIEHYLGLLSPDVELKDIESVYSHEQILNQCADFISSQMPNAKSCAVESSAAAAVRVGKSKNSRSAVIASRQTLISHGFNVVSGNISDIKDNQTRFVLIQRKGVSNSQQSTGASQVTSLAIVPGSDRKGLLLELLKIISEKHTLNLLSIHSRPDLKGGFVFFLDIQGSQSQNAVSKCVEELKSYCKQLDKADSGIYLFGSYNRQAYDVVVKNDE